MNEELLVLVTFQKKPISIKGSIPIVGEHAPDFELCSSDLNALTLAAMKGKKLILNIFPSVDTDVCASSVRILNHMKSRGENDLQDVLIVCISKDLPFAMKRFFDAEGISNCIVGSCFRSTNFMQDYGVEISSGLLRGLAARSIIVVGKDGLVKYNELVPEITDEPNYKAAILACKN